MVRIFLLILGIFLLDSYTSRSQVLSFPGAPSNYVESIIYEEEVIKFSDVDTTIEIKAFERYRHNVLKRKNKVEKYLLPDSSVVEIRVNLDSLFHHSKLGNPKYTYSTKDGMYFYDQDSILIDSVRFTEIDSTYTPDTVLTLLNKFSVPDSSDLDELANNGWTYQYLDSNIVRIDTSGFYMVYNGDSSSVIIQFVDSTNLLMYTGYQDIIEDWYYPEKEITKSATRFLYGSGTAIKYIVRSELVYDGPINQLTTNHSKEWIEAFSEQVIGNESQLSITPNPVSESITLLIIGDDVLPSVQYVIYDIYGQRLKAGTSAIAGLTNHRIDVRDLSPGSYILKYNSELYQGLVKFVKID